MNPEKLLSAGLAILALASCQRAADPYLELETKSLSFESGGGTATVTISSNVYYRVNNDCTDAFGDHHWAKITGSDTNGEHTVLHFEVEENTGLSERVGTVRFIGDNVTPLKLTLKQKGFVEKGITPETANLECSGGSVTFKVFGDLKWTATCTDTDVQISPSSGLGDTDVTVTVPENKELSARTVTVNVEMVGDKTYAFTVTQNAFVQKGISPESADVETSGGSASFKVFCDCNWTATCTDTGVQISPSSGSGNADVTVTVPANTELSAKTVTVNVEMGEENIYAFTVTQNAYFGVLADWNISALKAKANETFTDGTDQTVFPGTDGKYLNADTGSGKIEYYAAERTNYVKNGVSCKRSVGGNGDLLISGAIPEDYWLITVDRKIPAGTKLHYYFVTKPGTATSSYWMIEYKSGEEWKPTVAVSSVHESSTVGLTGNAVEYSADIEYNFAGTLLDTSNNGAYIAVDGTFTVDSDAEPLQIRFRQAGHIGLVGAKYNGQYIDQTLSGGAIRLSAQKPSTINEDGYGVAVKEYDQHVTIETAE